MYSRRSPFCGVFFILFLHCTDALQPAKLMKEAATRPAWLGRRDAIKGLLGTLVGAELLNKQADVAVAAVDDFPDFSVYLVRPDSSASLDPRLLSLSPTSFLDRVCASRAGALWLGEHHNSARDHKLQARIIKEIYENRHGAPMAVGLEHVQAQFQPVLDDFVAGKMTMTELRENVEWDKRWGWPFSAYEPVFDLVKQLKIPLVALNVDWEDLAMVEKGGLPGLPPDRLQKYILDAPGFAAFARGQQFAAYVEYVIRPSYNLHQTLGLLRHTMSGEKLDQDMSFRNFLSGHILWDEAMATKAYSWTEQNDAGLLVGLVGTDHVKFHDGIPGRYQRMVNKKKDCISVMLNPTLIDTRPSGSVALVPGADSSEYPDRLTLQVLFAKEGVDPLAALEALTSGSFDGGVLPLADFLLIG